MVEGREAGGRTQQKGITMTPSWREIVVAGTRCLEGAEKNGRGGSSVEMWEGLRLGPGLGNRR